MQRNKANSNLLESLIVLVWIKKFKRIFSHLNLSPFLDLKLEWSDTIFENKVEKTTMT
jgi:hypothetical protein